MSAGVKVTQRELGQTMTAVSGDIGIAVGMALAAIEGMPLNNNEAIGIASAKLNQLYTSLGNDPNKIIVRAVVNGIMDGLNRSRL